MKSSLATILFALTLLLSVPVSADAVVNVIVRNASSKPVDGVVSLAPTGDGKSFRCTTANGACTMRSVPGGRYIASFKPKAGSAPAPRKVVIPPSGSADLHITAK
ncbi:MAG: hypothetical protein WBG86_18950 [Polyangiales bacterium]